MSGRVLGRGCRSGAERESDCLFLDVVRDLEGDK